MNPCYTQCVPTGQFVALHLCSRLQVEHEESPECYVLLADFPGDICSDTLYVWSAYPEVYRHCVTSEHTTGNEVAAHEMLERLVLHLASGKGGMIDLDEVSASVVDDLGLAEVTQ